jgi:large subunit ribosomal protein L29
MAVLKRRAVHELDSDELAKRLTELRLEVAKEKGHAAFGAAPTNPGRISETKRAIARILTELSNRKTKEVV